MGEVEFTARVEELAGPGYAPVACSEAEEGRPLSSTDREVQQPYNAKHSASGLLK
jgi:hypothetical protein